MQLFGRRAGIIRSSAEPRWLSLLQLEWAAVLGLILIIAGGAGTVYAFSEWTASGFGPLDPRGPIRVVLPSATAVSAGALVLFSGIVGSLLTLVRPVLRDPVSTAANDVVPKQPVRVNDLV